MQTVVTRNVNYPSGTPLSYDVPVRRRDCDLCTRVRPVVHVCTTAMTWWPHKVGRTEHGSGWRRPWPRFTLGLLRGDTRGTGVGRLPIYRKRTTESTRTSPAGPCLFPRSLLKTENVWMWPFTNTVAGKVLLYLKSSIKQLVTHHHLIVRDTSRFPLFCPIESED